MVRQNNNEESYLKNKRRKSAFMLFVYLYIIAILQK